MLKEKTVVDKIEVVGAFRHIQVRRATIIERDGVEISRVYDRYVINPGDDYSNEISEIQGMCALLHTPEIIQAYNESVSDASRTITQDS